MKYQKPGLQSINKNVTMLFCQGGSGASGGVIPGTECDAGSTGDAPAPGACNNGAADSNDYYTACGAGIVLAYWEPAMVGRGQFKRLLSILRLYTSFCFLIFLTVISNVA